MKAKLRLFKNWILNKWTWRRWLITPDGLISKDLIGSTSFVDKLLG